ncbi:hypothetical protein F8M41_001372 [Gigaspora margarita]|uniref:Transmembrane protein n=1 Tax=Gigaspora margarita TaxID=4874 RepID=A0A8H3XEL7_GIGMA|nr:hypothetical protein F8M41_001372 [Gigaspora margarita]
MNVLKHRHATESQEKDQVEILDEHEQENLIEEFRTKNDRANNIFKKILVFFSLSIMILYLIFFYELMKNSISPSIPLPTSEKIYSHTPYPMISAILSISSLLFSVYILQSQIVTVVHLYCGIFLSLVSTIMAIGMDRMEQFWWGIPLGLLIIDIIALYIIKDSEQDISGLEKLKYKYKGA